MAMMENDKTQQIDLTGTDSLLTPADEQLVDNFFATQSQGVVADNGFSERVMHRLPTTRKYRLNRIWTMACSVVGVVMLWLMNGFSVFVSGLQNLVGDLIGAVAAFVVSCHVSPLLVICSLVVLGVVGLVNAIGSEEQYI